LERIEGVDTELSDLSRSSAANPTVGFRRLSDDLEPLQEHVDSLGFGDALLTAAFRRQRIRQCGLRKRSIRRDGEAVFPHLRDKGS
jgi:hypothetical protein